MTDPDFTFSALEIRVLGTLLEKQRTVPDTYPLSLNALTAGCNQKTSRNPVIEAGEPEILQAVDALKDAGFVVDVSGSRVVRFAHCLERKLNIPTQSSALLAVLMLRGPQTAGELRLNCERLHSFADISAVEAFLEELATRSAGALVVELPRLPGSRENRWAHLLAGMPMLDATASRMASSERMAGDEIVDLRNRVAALEAEVRRLGDLLTRVAAS
jgi:uncharacterized protein YceH (UPF0502 family)